jgi:cytochrome c-type biogenesis protein CcmH/NrfF
MTRSLLVALIAFATFLPATGAQAQTTPAPTSASAPASASKANLIDLEDEVMCVICGRPLSTSGGAAADDERAFIQTLIDQGLDKRQIKEQMVREYGQDALVEDRSPIAGAAPIIAAVVGAVSIGVLLRRRRTGRRDELSGSDAAAGSAGPGSDPDAAATHAPAKPTADDDARIDAELAERT